MAYALVTWTVAENGSHSGHAAGDIGDLPAWLAPYVAGNPDDCKDLRTQGHPGRGYWPVTESVASYDSALEVQTGPVITLDANARTVTRTYGKAYKPLATVKAVRKSAAAIQLMARVSAGHVYNGATYQIDETSQNRMTSIAASANASLVVGGPAWTTIGWRTAANVKVNYTTALGFLAFANSMKLRVQELRAKYWELVDDIEAAANVAAVLAVDVTAGWPGE